MTTSNLARHAGQRCLPGPGTFNPVRHFGQRIGCGATATIYFNRSRPPFRKALTSFSLVAWSQASKSNSVMMPSSLIRVVRQDRPKHSLPSASM